jgi:hypothetical protein
MDSLNFFFVTLESMSPRFLLWCIDPLLGKNLETNNETTAVAMQQRDKHACTTRQLLLETVYKTIGATQLVVSCQLSAESWVLHWRLWR